MITPTPITLKTYTDRLTTFIDTHLPLLVNMEVKVSHYDGSCFRVKMPLGCNHNDKMTGFGGSLYCLCIINTIGLAFLKCYEAGLTPDLVVTHADVRYLAPAKDAIIIAETQSPDKSRWDTFFDDYHQHGKAKIALASRIFQGEQLAVEFTGQFALIGER